MKRLHQAHKQVWKMVDTGSRSRSILDCGSQSNNHDTLEMLGYLQEFHEPPARPRAEPFIEHLTSRIQLSSSFMTHHVPPPPAEAGVEHSCNPYPARPALLLLPDFLLHARPHTRQDQ